MNIKCPIPKRKVNPVFVTSDNHKQLLWYLIPMIGIIILIVVLVYR